MLQPHKSGKRISSNQTTICFNLYTIYLHNELVEDSQRFLQKGKEQVQNHTSNSSGVGSSIFKVILKVHF